MELPDFELGPLEMLKVADDEPAIAPASTRVPVDGEDFLLRSCLAEDESPRLFFRLDQPDSPVLQANHEYNDDARNFVARIWAETHKPHSMNLAPFLEPFLQSWGWNRTFIIKQPNGSSGTCSLQTTYGQPDWDVNGKRGSFMWPRATQLPVSWLLRASSAAVVHEVEKWLADSNNDGGFALRWAQLDLEAEMRLVTVFRNGDWNELKRVLEWVTWEHAVCWPDYSHGQWNVYLEFYSGGANYYELELDERCVSETHLPKSVARWLTVIDAYFRPVHNKQLERFTQIYRINRAGSFCYPLCFSAPSHHERLEARLCLREWLADKVAPDQIPALLGEA